MSVISGMMARARMVVVALVMQACAAIVPALALAQAPEAGLPLPPEDPAAAKAYAAFDQFCARCHQTGKLKGARAAGSFANILDLKAVAANMSLVRPGNPDASRIYTVMLARAMPYDVAHDARGAEPTATELTAVREWLQGLAPAGACSERKMMTPADDVAAVSAAVRAAGADAANLRFISQRTLHNGCPSNEELAAFGEAVTWLVNSLSFGLEPVKLETVEGAGHIYQINLTRIGWDRRRWERLIAGYPYAADSDVDREIVEKSGTAVPIVRSDWFAAAATHMPLYYDLLGVPERLASLQSGLQIDVIGDMAAARARRVGTRLSPIARGSRLVQRHPFVNGSYWTTFEYAPTAGRADLFDAPASGSARSALKADANLVMFSLPNGFNAFYIANTDGIRVNALPPSVLRNEARPGQPLSGALACASCHENGPRGAEDELRSKLQADTSLSREGRDRLLAMHASSEEMKRLIEDDVTRLTRALELSGIDRARRVDGLMPIEALARRYQRKISIAEAARELGVTDEALAALAERDRLAVGDRTIVDRLRFGLASRGEFEAHYGALSIGLGQRKAQSAESTLPIVTAGLGGELQSEIDLVLRADKQVYAPGELLSIRVRAGAPCFLTLISVDRNGRGTVIYPNDFEQNNQLEAGKEIQVPALNAPYQFRLRDKGRETVIAVCTPTQKAADGIKHDFERQRFTELGDYRAFLARSWTTETEERRGLVPAKDARNRRTSRKPGEPGSARYEPQGRTAIQIDVR